MLNTTDLLITMEPCLWRLPGTPNTLGVALKVCNLGLLQIARGGGISAQLFN